MTDIEKIDKIVEHKQGIITATSKLGHALIKAGEVRLGRELIANGYIHDDSKFHGIEFLHLYNGNPNKDAFMLAMIQHQSVNMHHPEYWGAIQEMHRLYVAEMVCDWKTRSSEFATDLQGYITNVAMDRFKFTARDKVHEEIAYFKSLLCDTPFTALRPESGG